MNEIVNFGAVSDENLESVLELIRKGQFDDLEISLSGEQAKKIVECHFENDQFLSAHTIIRKENTDTAYMVLAFKRAE